MNGPLSITFFPYPKLSADDAELTAAGIHINAPHLRLAAKLWPLFRGHIILSSADIENPKITVNPELWQSAREAQDIISRIKIQLGDVEIQNGELDITLGQNHEVVTDIDLQLRAPDWHGPYQADADFIWRDQDWEFSSQLGVKTAAGTRPANFTLKQSDGPHQFAWHGAVRPVPLAMHGDAEWQSADQHLALKTELNVNGRIAELAHGQLAVDGGTAGIVNGHFMIGANRWQDLHADIADMAPARMAGLHLPGLAPFLQTWNGAGALRLSLINGGLSHLQFESPELNLSAKATHWHVWGTNARDALALWNPDVRAWPVEVATPFDVRLTQMHDALQMDSLRIGKFLARGIITSTEANMQTETLGWPAGGAVNAWRAALHKLGLQTVTLHAREWNLQPFTNGDGTMTFNFKPDADHLDLQTPDMHVTGDFTDDEFTGQTDCVNARFLRAFHAPCHAAQISTDGGRWQLTSALDADNAAAPNGHGVINLAAGTWNLQFPFSRGQISGDGKLGQNEWRMNVTGLTLRDVLQNFMPNAPRGDGDINGQLRVTADKADGDITATNLQLPALNLWLDNPAQPGKIATITAKANWQNGVLELEQLHTTGPSGAGQASANLDSQIWHGEWVDAHSGRVVIDGPVDSASAQKQRANESTRP